MLDWITKGYVLPLITDPPAYKQANQKSALEHKEFVDEAITDLLNNGCIQRVPTAPHMCSPLSVVCNSEGKKRLVVNLRYINQFLKIDSFKYEDLRTLLSILNPTDFLFKFDLKSGYHHVEIFEPHWKYLGFAGVRAREKLIIYLLSYRSALQTACYVFTSFYVI